MSSCELEIAGRELIVNSCVGQGHVGVKNFGNHFNSCVGFWTILCHHFESKMAKNNLMPQKCPKSDALPKSEIITNSLMAAIGEYSLNI